MPNSPTLNGAHYLFAGFSLLKQKGLRRFVLIPLLINIMLFATAFYFAIQEITHYMGALEAWLPSWLQWLSTLLWPLMVIAILVIFSFIFSTAANWLAAPFNGMLSEKVELLLTQQSINDDGLGGLIKDIPRTLGRECTKFMYYLPKALGFLLVMLLVPVIGQVIWFIFVAWMMAVQYKDYPFDNHKIPFNVMKDTIKQKQQLSYSFGATVTLFSLIPIINMIVMPAAICGATKLWVEHYRQEFV